MFGYYFDLALRSLRRNWIMTALMVLAIGLGIGASMTMLTVLHVMSGDPLPGRSAQLYRPYLDPLPLDYKSSGYGPDASVNLTWPDAMALLDAHKGVHQAVISGTSLVVQPLGHKARARNVDGRMTTHGFFAMFGLRFLHGSAWGAAEDAGRARVVVLTRSLAERMFGRADVVGREARLGDHDYRVVGVVANWSPRPMFYVDAATKLFSGGDQFFLPLATGVDLKLDTSGNVSSWKAFHGDMRSPHVTWLQFWVQLDTPGQVAAYRTFLANYTAQQKSLGRFERPASHTRLYGLMEWLNHQNLVPGDIRLQAWLALGFLLVCMLNIVALLLAKFLRRGGEISVRRALGARRGDIFVQFGVESALIGLAGGVLGLVIAEIGLWSVRRRPDDYAHLAHMDPVMLLGTFALAVTASVLAGLLPAWRAGCIAPALQLKTL